MSCLIALGSEAVQIMKMQEGSADTWLQLRLAIGNENSKSGNED